jgi:hypothetical protein
MNSHLTSSPDFSIRHLETPTEIEAFVRLNAATFRPDEDWAMLQPDQDIPPELTPILNILFPAKEAWIAGSDYF